MCPPDFVSSPSQRKAVLGLVENSRKDTDVVVFTPQFISLLLINDIKSKNNVGQLSSTFLVWALKGNFLPLQVLICDLNPSFISLINCKKVALLCQIWKS